LLVCTYHCRTRKKQDSRLQGFHGIMGNPAF